MTIRKEHQAKLRERAKLLAIEPKITEAESGFLNLITFTLASETYAIESSFVREIYPLKTLTLLPGTPEFVLGIVNVRGQIMSVIDLKKFFHLPDKGIGELNKMIIVRDETMEFGILADTILGTQRVPRLSILPPLETITGIGAAYLQGVTAGHLIILNGQKIVQDEKIIVYTGIT